MERMEDKIMKMKFKMMMGWLILVLKTKKKIKRYFPPPPLNELRKAEYRGAGGKAANKITFEDEEEKKHSTERGMKKTLKKLDKNALDSDDDNPYATSESEEEVVVKKVKKDDMMDVDIDVKKETTPFQSISSSSPMALLEALKKKKPTGTSPAGRNATSPTGSNKQGSTSPQQAMSPATLMKKQTNTPWGPPKTSSPKPVAKRPVSTTSSARTSPYNSKDATLPISSARSPLSAEIMLASVSPPGNIPKIKFRMTGAASPPQPASQEKRKRSDESIKVSLYYEYRLIKKKPTSPEQQSPPSQTPRSKQTSPIYSLDDERN